MKRFTLILLAVILYNFSFSQENKRVILSDEKSFLEIIDNGFQGVRFTLKQEDINLSVKKTVLGDFITIHSHNLINTFTPGFPDLPVVSKLIEVPFGASVSVKVVDYEEQIVELRDFWGDKKIVPAQPSASKSDDPHDIPFHFKNDVYSSDIFLNSETAIYEEVGVLRSTRLGRVEIRPIQYNPARNQLRILNELVVEISFEDSDFDLTTRLKESYSSPFLKSLPGVSNQLTIAKSVVHIAPVTYVIVSDPMFQETLQPFIDWKKRKGFHVIEAYTNDPAVGTTTTSIQNYLKNLYVNPEEGVNPPTFGLLVGDVAQIPAFTGTTGSHKTDLYYFEYTADKLPEVIYGRFSAQNVEQLVPQINKTLLYEMYLMEDPTYLENNLLIAGVDATWSPVYANGHIRYAHSNYSNPANNINPYTYLYNDAAGSTTGIASNNSSASADIRDKISAGVGLANYTAHCSSSGWSNPVVGTSNIPALTNIGKYGIWIGNCCQSNKFDLSECFGEAALRAIDKGALGYIGGSNDTYWYEDYYFGVGSGTPVAFPDYNNFGTGMYDALFHTQVNEVNDPSKWYVSQGQLLMGGNLAVQASSSSRKAYYWEIYHLMGDPSLTPYLGVPQPMEVEFPIPVLMINLTEFEVITAPFAQISLNQNGISLSVSNADINGNATLHLPVGLLEVGEAEIVITAQNRQPYIESVPVVSSEPYANFYADKTVSVIGEEVVFTDASDNGDFSSWEWSFGQGATPESISGKGPHTVIYSTPGYKTISLVVDGQYERVRTAYIYVKDIFTLSISTQGNGTVSVDGEMYEVPLQIIEGTKVILNAAADDYWSFREWTGDLSGNLPQAELVLNTSKNVTAEFVNVASATYSEGDIPTDNTFTTLPGQSTCPATLVVSIPLGSTITSVDVEYTMTASNQGWKSEQRSQLRCISSGGLSEETIFAGTGNSEGKMVYSRKGLALANGVLGGGDVVFELHAGRTWSTSGYSGCSVYNNKVDNGSWKVYVYYEPGGIKFPEIAAWPEATDIIYGESLVDSQLEGGLAEFDGEQVPGIFAFIKPDSVPYAGIHNVGVEFVPNDLETYGLVQGNISLTVTQRVLTIDGTFEAMDKIYDGTNQASISQDNLILSGIISDDDVSLIPVIQFSDKNVGENKLVTISETTSLEGEQIINYTLSFEGVPTSFASISPIELQVEGAAASAKFYDGNNVAPITGAVLNGILPNDDVHIGNHTFGYFSQINVGENIPVTTGMMISGADAGNYLILQPADLFADILPKELLVVNALALDKIYDGNFDASLTGAELAGAVEDDDVILENYSVGTFAQADVGENIIVEVDMSITGTDSFNYFLTQPSLSANITQRELNIGGSFSVLDKIFDGTTTATISSSNLIPLGTVSGDVIEIVDPVAEFEDAEVGADKVVLLISVDITGDKRENYTISYSNAPIALATIHPVAPTQFAVTVNHEGNGTIEVNGESYSESLNFDEGTEISIKAIPDEGWMFKQWQGDISGTGNPQIVVVNSNISTIAQFTEIPKYSISVTIVGSGQVTIDETTYIEQLFVYEGTELTFDVQPETNWKFDGWSIDLSGSTHPVQLLVNSNKTIGATFSPITDINEGISRIPEVYPNPFKNQVFIRNTENVTNVVITNLIGQRIIEVNNIGDREMIITTDKLTKGIYVITLMSSKGDKVIRKIMKE